MTTLWRTLDMYSAIDDFFEEKAERRILPVNGYGRIEIVNAYLGSSPGSVGNESKGILPRDGGLWHPAQVRGLLLGDESASVGG